MVFDLYPMVEFCPFVPQSNTPDEVIEKLGDDANVSVFNVMCLDDEHFEELCDLYPDSKETIALFGMNKRKVFMEKLEEQRKCF